MRLFVEISIAYYQFLMLQLIGIGADCFYKSLLTPKAGGVRAPHSGAAGNNQGERYYPPLDCFS